MKRQLGAILCALLCISLLVVPVNAEKTAAFDAQITKEQVYAALYEADLASLRDAVCSGLITSTELTQYYLDRIKAYNAPYNCFITICDDALAVAAQRDEQWARGEAEGLLFGVPIVIKDNMDLKGFHTTNGFAKSKNQIAKSNAAVVQYLLDEGAVIIAKANMSTEAQDALRSSSQAVGETKNAYSRYLAAGGSSGGSAVSTSLNFTAASLGTDTNSSLRIPAALAGCVSLRPTFGKISVAGIKKLNGTRDVPGAITRSVYDQAIMLDVLTQGAYQYTENLNANALKGMRIGVLKQLSYASTKTGLRSDANIDDEVAAAFENAITELRNCGAEVITVSMSNLFTLSDKTFASNAAAPKTELYNAFQKLLQDNNISAVIYPTYLSTPIRSGTDENGVYWSAYSQTNINNCRTLSPSAGIPEITVPIGQHSLGAGIGMEIASSKNSEQLLLDIAYSYTSVYDHRAVPTGAPNDYAQSNTIALSHMAACRGAVQTALDAVRDFKINLPLDKAKIHMLSIDPAAQNPFVVLQYWPFAVLVILVLWVLGLMRRLRIRKRRRARQRARQERQRIS